MTTGQTDFKQDLVKLRELTGAGMMDCNKALKEAGGDIEKAKELIRKKGLDIAKKKASREAREGQIATYIHAGGKLGVLVEINCETDFVARNEEFQDLCRNLAMHVAAAHPLYVSPESMPVEVLEKEKEIFSEEVKGKPEQIKEKILDGKLKKRYEELCLLNQKYIKDDSVTVKEYLDSMIAKLGENIVIKRFVRFEVGGTN